MKKNKKSIFKCLLKKSPPAGEPTVFRPQGEKLGGFKLTELLDAQDVMFLLHISPRTLQTFRYNGTLPYTRIGKKFYFCRADIENILTKNYIKKTQK